MPSTSTPSRKQKVTSEKKMTPLSKCLYKFMKMDPLGMFLYSEYCPTCQTNFC